MSILRVSDLHAQEPWFAWVAKEAERSNWAVALTGANSAYNSENFARTVNHTCAGIMLSGL